MKIKSFIILVAALAVSVSAFAQDPANEVKKKFNTAATHYNNKEYDKALPLLEECVVEGLDADVMTAVYGFSINTHSQYRHTGTAQQIQRCQSLDFLKSVCKKHIYHFIYVSLAFKILANSK